MHKYIISLTAAFQTVILSEPCAHDMTEQFCGTYRSALTGVGDGCGSGPSAT